MAAKCAYVEKVGAVYYVRKRIPRAWSLTFGHGVLRMSLRTTYRPTALRLGLGALAVFEQLLSRETEDGLIHLMECIIREMDLQPEDMTTDDLVRRNALSMIGRKLIRRAADFVNVDTVCPPLREEFVHFNHATVQGEAYRQRVEQREAGLAVVVPARRSQPDLSSLREVIQAFKAERAGEIAEVVVTPAPKAAPPVPAAAIVPEQVHAKSNDSEVWTMRALLDDYMRRDGKETGSDNKTNLERAVGLFEAIIPRGKAAPVTDIGLKEWDEVYSFMQNIPKTRGQSVDNIASLTRKMMASGESYEKLSVTTLNSNYSGALVRLIRYGNGRRVISMPPPSLAVRHKKRATSSARRVPFAPPEITTITKSPVYVGSASVHHRYSPGKIIKFDDHIYWAPLIAMHTGMRVTEIGMLQFEQMQDWFDRPTFVLEIGDDDQAKGVGYKTSNALRRVPLHRQLLELGLQDFFEHQKRLGFRKPFPDWAEHVKGGAGGVPEVHYEADFFNQHRARWNVPAERRHKLTFHSFRGFFIQGCLSAKINPYTTLKMVGHDDELATQTSAVHRGYLSQDLTGEEMNEIDRVSVPLAPMSSFKELVQRHGSGSSK